MFIALQHMNILCYSFATFMLGTDYAFFDIWCLLVPRFKNSCCSLSFKIRLEHQMELILEINLLLIGHMTILAQNNIKHL